MIDREGGRGGGGGGGGGRPDSPMMNRRMPSPDMRGRDRDRERDRDMHDRDLDRGYFPPDGAVRGGVQGARGTHDFDRGSAREFSPRYMGEISVRVSRVSLCPVWMCFFV